jgi:predicted nuclease of predicted toxin-antitoxin system
MKFVADENIDADIIHWLRAQGLDVLSVGEMMKGSSDPEVLRRSNVENRILLTKEWILAN